MSEETDLLKTIRHHFLRTVVALSEKVEIDTRLDIRDKIAALALIDRVLAREKTDESDRGSAVRRYATAFKAADGIGRATDGPGPAAEPGRNRGIDPGEQNDDEDDAGIPTAG